MERYIDVVLVERNDKGELVVKPIKNFHDELHNIYKTIKCRCIDIVQRKIKGRIVEFIVDDEYLLTDKPKDAPTGICSTSPLLEQIYGAFLITGPGDQDGNLTSLSKKDIDAINGARCVASRTSRYDENDVSYFDVIAYSI